MSLRIGMDVGATKTKILLIDHKGGIKDRTKIPTDSDKDPMPIVKRSSEAIRELLAKNKTPKSKVEAVCVGICGFSNPKTGVIDISPNLHWREVPFIELMEKEIEKKVYMANDVNAAAWGEYMLGAGKGEDDVVAIFIGSGIGGGFVAGGRLVEGGTGTAGEVGHTIFRPGGLKCDCGKRGCFEAYGGGMPMERRMRRALKRGLSPKVMEKVGGDLEKVNTRVIRVAAERGDKVAGRIWREAEESLGYLCANLVSLLNPDRLVIGGGVAGGNPGLMPLLKKYVAEQSVSLSGRHVDVVESALGDDAVAMGASALVDLYR